MFGAFLPPPLVRANACWRHHVRTRRRPSMTLPITPSAARVGTSWEPGASFVSSSEGPNFQEQVNQLVQAGALSSDAANTLLGWRASYAQAASQSPDIGASEGPAFAERAFRTLLMYLVRHRTEPLQFAPFHQALDEYYSFGVDFAFPLVDFARSTVSGVNHLYSAQRYLALGHNVVFLSNHQSEADPYALDALLTRVAGLPSDLARSLVFMAGDRVRDDPVVAPFSAGRNLLTVYSRKHLDDVPAMRAAKVSHNRRTISVTQRLFSKGGCAVWFAPSGGRDRRGPDGRVSCSLFDPDAIEMMRVTARKAGSVTHFFPMALVTYDMLPPPSNVGGAALGEERIVNHAPLAMSVGQELEFPVVDESQDKKERRASAARLVYDLVEAMYAEIGGYDI